jgi:hypothetical protein
VPTTTAATPTSTTLPTRELKAQIAADYERASKLLDELATNPTLENLDARLARIVAPGSRADADVEGFVRDLVASNERVIDNDPDYSTIEVERVELRGKPPYERATVTSCWVSNRLRIDADGNRIAGTGALVAARQIEPVELTQQGWLPSGRIRDAWEGTEVTERPPA